MFNLNIDFSDDFYSLIQFFINFPCLLQMRIIQIHYELIILDLIWQQSQPFLFMMVAKLSCLS